MFFHYNLQILVFFVFLRLFSGNPKIDRKYVKAQNTSFLPKWPKRWKKGDSKVDPQKTHFLVVFPKPQYQVRIWVCIGQTPKTPKKGVQKMTKKRSKIVKNTFFSCFLSSKKVSKNIKKTWFLIIFWCFSKSEMIRKMVKNTKNMKKTCFQKKNIFWPKIWQNGKNHENHETRFFRFFSCPANNFTNPAKYGIWLCTPQNTPK